MGSKQRRSATQSDSLFTRVDEVRVFLTGLRVASKTQDTILRLKDNLNVLRKEGRSNKRHSDTQVNVHSVLELLRSPLDDAFTACGGVTRA